MDYSIVEQISSLVAKCLNDGHLDKIASGLDAIFANDATSADKLAALCVTPIYALATEQPGYPDNGRPGYLPCGSDLKKAVLDEIAVMIEADFDKDEHQRIWQTIRKNVEATPEKDFLPGVAVNCPDGYLLTLDKLFVSEVLRQRKLLPSW